MKSDDSSDHKRSWVTRTAGSTWFLPTILLAWFAPVVIGVQRFAFRDVSHFFTPLYGYLRLRTQDSWLPLWNPLDQTGIPILGESTTALLYPVRWIVYAIPVSPEHAMGLYCVVHVLVAAWTARWATLRWIRCRSGSMGHPASPADATHGSIIANLGGLIYAGSGTLMFLVCNPPFLAGASWLPLALTPLVVRSNAVWKDCLLAGCGMAFMVLAGDPQTALHACMIGSVVTIASVFRPTDASQSQGWANACIRLVAPASIACALSAPQIVGSAMWANQSERLRGDTVESSSWWKPPRTGSRRQESFQFSFPPWHTWELFSPMPFGSLMPHHHRWSASIPGDGRMWTSSIYAGLIACLGLLGGVRQTNRMWWWIGLVSLLAACGPFGGMWLVQNLTQQGEKIDSALGGVYGALYHWFPGYSAFRYPAKWLPLFALSVAMLTAQLLADRDARQSKFLRNAAFCVIAVHALLGLLAMTGHDLVGYTIGKYGPPQADEFWGPFQREGAQRQHLVSVLHTSSVALVVVFLAHLEWCRRTGLATKTVPSTRNQPCFHVMALLLLTLTELSLCQISLVPKLSMKQEQEALAKTTPPFAQVTQKTSDWMRTQSNGQWPFIWADQSSSVRVLEVEITARRNWWSRWHLLDGARVWNSSVSIRSQAYADFWRAMKTKSDIFPEEHAATTAAGNLDAASKNPWPSIQKWLGIGGTVQVSRDAVKIQVDGQSLQIGKARIGSLPSASLDLQFSPRFLTMDSLSDPRPDEAHILMQLILQRVVSSGGEPRPMVHDLGEGLRFAERSTLSSDGQASEVRIIRQSPEMLRATVRSDRGGLLHRSVYQDGDWVASWRPKGETTWRDAKVHVVDELRQGVILPKGELEVRIQYRPWWLGWSLFISGAAWIACAACLGRLKATEKSSLNFVRR